MIGAYGLDGEPLDMVEAGRLLADYEARTVGHDEWRGTGWAVSTVFLVWDHSHGIGERPVLWESMVFGPGDEDVIVRRYTSRQDAEAGHEELVEQVRVAIEGPRVEATGR